ncbi:MAG: 3-oxoacyl-ACP synthase III family protein [Nannocystaceae bacterium]
MPGLTIIGTGRYVPGNPISNTDLMRVMDTDDAWIRQRTGIHQRYYAPEGVGSSELGAKAAAIAIESAGIDPSEIDYILAATMTADYVFPGIGGQIGAKLGLGWVPALDIRQQCAAIPYAMQVADCLVAGGAASTVLVVGADAHAGFMPWKDWDVVYGTSDRKVSQESYQRATEHRGLAVLFGDGAGAMVMRKSETPGHGYWGAQLHTDGELVEGIFIPGGSFCERPYWKPEMSERHEEIPRMNGRELFRSAVKRLPAAIRTLCDRHNVTLDDVDWFIAHQANDRINAAVRDALKIPAEKVPSNIAKYGNTSAGTIGILMDEMARDGRLQRGQLLCVFALGAGLNWGAVLMRY